MNSTADIRGFLVTRRARISPDRAGIRYYGKDRRVPGLRREEVATLVGVSLDYYTKLERGRIHNASDGVLNALSAALQLSAAEHQHLFDLARNGHGSAAQPQQAAPPSELRPSVQALIDNTAMPVIVHNSAQDLIGSNELGRRLYGPLFIETERPNIARFIFQDPIARTYYGDWHTARNVTAAMMRLEAGRSPHNLQLLALIDELTEQSPEFCESWELRNVHDHRTGTKFFVLPESGRIDVTFDVFDVPDMDSVKMVFYSPTDSSESLAAFDALAQSTTQ